MSLESENNQAVAQTVVHGHEDFNASLRHADDVLLAKLGYKSEFRREFSVMFSVYAIRAAFNLT